MKNATVLLFFGLLLALLCRLVWLNPFYNWDILPSAALVNEPSSDPVKLHTRAYAAADAETPPEVARSFRISRYDPVYRQDLAENPWHFAEQLPLYSVKPLYVLALAAMHRAGLGTITASRLLSLISFAVFGAVVFLWLRKFSGGLIAALCACLLLCAPDFISAGAETTPDAFFAALALLGLYLVFAKKRVFVGWCLLAIVPLVRSDGLVLVALALAYDFWKSRLVPRRFALAILGVEIFASQITAWMGGGYGYLTLFYHSFVVRTPALAEAVIHLNPADYFHALGIFVLGSLSTPRPLYFLLGLIALKARGTPPELRDMAWLALAFTAIHILLFPLPDSRFLIMPFALIVLWAAGSLAANSRQLMPRPNWWR